MHHRDYSFLAEYTPIRRRSSGFTLIELLVVMAVIIILASITFGISRAVTSAQARSKAQGELAILSQALEQYKSTYGDYPWVEGTSSAQRSRSLVDALTGRRFIERSGDEVILSTRLTLQQVADQRRPQFVDITRLTVDRENDPQEFQDPWGRAYEYHYKQTGSVDDWTRFGFILYSRGQRGEELDVQSSGRITDSPDDIAANGIIITDQ